VSIGQIVRELIKDQKVYLDRPYYRWRIVLNWPALVGRSRLAPSGSHRRSWPIQSSLKGNICHSRSAAG
jgi:hypothetical protein